MSIKSSTLAELRPYYSEFFKNTLKCLFERREKSNFVIKIDPDPDPAGSPAREAKKEKFEYFYKDFYFPPTNIPFESDFSFRYS